MKKIILLLAALALSFGAFSCGGGGAGSSNTPPGENPGIPSVVQLSPSHYIAQTNANITLHAKVLDGNGVPLASIKVTFTNLSAPFGVLSATSANTNGDGIATVTIYSTTPGFATILAQVNTGVGIVRDRKSVFFSSLDVLAVSMGLDVDSVPGNEIFNQTDDITLFQDPPIPQPDDTVKVRVTVRDGGGNPVGGGWSVSWSSSHSEAVFLRQDTQTSTSGVAEAVVQVTPASIRNTDTLVNVAAYAGNGAANMVTLFLKPVVISPALSSVTANPSTVETGGTSDVTAVVFLNTGATAPDGTVVNFSTAPKTAADPSPCGAITPFVATTGGVTDPPATFTAPSTAGVCTVTAKSGGVIIGTVDITVIEKFQVQPATQTVSGVTGGTATFTIFGGVPSYTITSSNPLFPPVPATVTTSGGTFTVNVPAGTPATTVTYTIKDKTGATVTATLTITGAGALSVSPNTGTVVGVDNPPAGNANGGCPPDISVSDDFTAFISGGIPPYVLVGTSNLAVVPVCAVTIAGSNITIDPDSVAASTAVTITIRDSAATPTTATITLTVTP